MAVRSSAFLNFVDLDRSHRSDARTASYARDEASHHNWVITWHGGCPPKHSAQRRFRMEQAIWTLANLSAEQERLLKEAEAALNGGALIAFERRDVTPTQLTPSQLECLVGLEQRLGLVIVALKRG
ncbi:hypothetical protein ACMHYB_57965 [Sorangium sp. So ce1128]